MPARKAAEVAARKLKLPSRGVRSARPGLDVRPHRAW